METLLKKESIELTGLIMDKQEECAMCGEYTLPDYCPDMAVILKCFVYPRLLNRQWSADKLLVDGSAMARVLYLSDDRCGVHSVEFSVPFSCALRSEGAMDGTVAEIDLTTKYVNCRALTSRKLEVRGMVLVSVCAESVERREVGCASAVEPLHVQTKELATTTLCDTVEKFVTIGESVEFDHSLPPAQMLLGGECRAVVRECKILNGKSIVKGQIYVHQLYTDSIDGDTMHCLHTSLPFSQILDVPCATEGSPYTVSVKVISDTERCVVGPDGENTMLDVSVKLLLQLRVYRAGHITVVNDAFHCGYPVSLTKEEMAIRTLLHSRIEDTKVLLSLPIHSERLADIVDVLVQPQECVAKCVDGKVEGKGKLTVCVLARDVEQEFVYHEYAGDYELEWSCDGNQVYILPEVTDCTYRVVENRLELVISLCASIREYQSVIESTVIDLKLCKEEPYRGNKATATLYLASTGEKVWDIGRACHASPACIRAENGLDGDELQQSSVVVVPLI